MIVTVEGHITSIEEKTKEEKKMTELLIAQQGQREQIPVRLEGHVAKLFTLFETNKFTGRLMTWKQREGIGTMVLANDQF